MSKRTATVLALLITALAAPLTGPASAASAAVPGLWKVTCGYVGSAPDDPIGLPGKPGAADLHDFFGNRSTNARSTYASMRSVASTCPQKDRAAYWTPALYRDGRKVDPTHLTAYYTASISPGEQTIEPFPPDFRMVTGNAGNTNLLRVSEHIQWGCENGSQIGPLVPLLCLSGGIQVRVTFPSCWNGKMTQGNAAGNMRYPSRGQCPSDFPRALPTVRVNVVYPTGVVVGAVTLASGSTASIHAQFWNTWDQPTLTRLVRDCMHARKQCPHFTGTTAGVVPKRNLTDAAGTTPAGHPTRPDAAADPRRHPPSRTAAPAPNPDDVAPSPVTIAPAPGIPRAPLTGGQVGAWATPKEQTWAFAGEQGQPSVWASLAVGALLLVCLATGGFVLARKRQRVATGSR